MVLPHDGNIPRMAYPSIKPSFELFLLQVRVTREGCSSDLHPSSEDGALQDPAAWSCGQIWHGDSSG